MSHLPIDDIRASCFIIGAYRTMTNRDYNITVSQSLIFAVFVSVILRRP
jgi:hypothetical protein